MRVIFVPHNLTPMHLLEVPPEHAELRDLSQQMLRHFRLAQYDEALSCINPTLSAKLSTRKRGAAALLLLYKADLQYHLHYWEYALEQTQRALKWLRLVVSNIADYNKMIAHYWEGLIHYSLRADDKALQSFDQSIKGLLRSERHWQFEDHFSRVEDCQNLSRWMRNLQDLTLQFPKRELTFIAPLYELENLIPIRMGAIQLTPFKVTLPKLLAQQCLPPGYIPLELDTFSFLHFRSDVHCIALRIPEDGYVSPKSQAGDILLLEITVPRPLEDEAPPRLNTNFVRRANGHIQLDLSRQAGEGLYAIPRLLIREEDEAWAIVNTTYS